MFSLGDASPQLLGVGTCGLLIVPVVRWLMAHLHQHLVDLAAELAV